MTFGIRRIHEDFGISSEKLVLKSLTWEGRIDGLAFAWTAVQCYENTSTKPIEVTYTFPMAWNTAITEFAATVNGERLVATSMPRAKAQKTYEKAMEEGDTPLMLECSDPMSGTLTANLGNVKPGEKVTVEISFAKVLRSNFGTVKVNIPTVVGMRYSPTNRQGAQMPHEEVAHSFAADYPATAKITVAGSLADARWTARNHSASFKKTQNGEKGELEITIDHAKADCDLVLEATDAKPVTEARYTVDAKGNKAGCVTVVCPGHNTEPAPLFLKVLVDCSGSMHGIAIQKTREALAALTDVLTERDYITVTCFGSDVRHDIGTPAAVTSHFVRRDLLPVIDRIDADLGGTEMEMAITDVQGIKTPAGFEGNAGILLITDGEVWQTEEVITRAKAKNERIFVIGVSSSPAQTVLNELAVRTGGVCDITMPTEDMTEVVPRMTDLMRTSSESVTVTTGKKKVTEQVFTGQSREFFFESVNPESEVSVETKEGTSKLAWRPLATDNTDNTDNTDGSSAFKTGFLTRLMAGELLRAADDFDEQEKISQKYGLIGPHVSFVMVKERAESDKVMEVAQLHRVEQMIPRDSFADSRICYSMSSPVFESPVCCSVALPEAFTSKKRSHSPVRASYRAPVRSVDSPLDSCDNESSAYDVDVPSEHEKNRINLDEKSARRANEILRSALTHFSKLSDLDAVCQMIKADVGTLAQVRFVHFVIGHLNLSVAQADELRALLLILCLVTGCDRSASAPVTRITAAFKKRVLDEVKSRNIDADAFGFDRLGLSGEILINRILHISRSDTVIDDDERVY